MIEVLFVPLFLLTGSLIIDQERRRIEELRRRAADEGRAQWEERRRAADESIRLQVREGRNEGRIKELDR